MQVNGPEGYKLTRKKFLAVGAACTAIHGPVPGLKGRAFELWILNRWVLIFCVSCTALREEGGGEERELRNRSREEPRFLLRGT